MADFEIHDDPRAVAEIARQRAADRSKRYRAAQKEEGRPDTKATDAAIAEAVAYLVSISHDPGHVAVDVREMTRVATIALVRDGYDRTWSRMAVVQRIRPRSLHDHVTMMPSRRLTATDAIIQPPIKGKWSPKDLAFVRGLIARWRDAVPAVR